ncbi:MAG TPA: ABC transporter permease [Anaerolineales bacterium]|nr:ABC transporter permease [Anaerolineales bacterium]
MTTAPPLSLPQLADDLSTPPLTLWQLGWLRFRRHKMAVFGGIILILLFVFSFGGALVYTEKFANFNDTSQRLQSPSSTHPFGTDSIGRDILARTIYGGQISLFIGFVAVLIETILGILVGALAGYYGGVIDSILMRITEALLNIPTIFLLLVMAKFFGGKVPDIHIGGRAFSGSVIVIVVIIGATSWMYLARIVRAEFLSWKEREFILAARATGTSNVEIIFYHILPNTIAPVIVSSTLSVANAILSESYISFLGLGVQEPTATWGNMLDKSAKYLDTSPWLWFFPGMLILLTTLAINFLGDGLRDALDPRSRTV